MTKRPAAKVELVITPTSQGSKITIDGVEVPNVRAVTIRAGVGEASSVTLELVAVDVLVKGEVADVTRLASTVAHEFQRGAPDSAP